MVENIIDLIRRHPIESVAIATVSPKLLNVAFRNAKEMIRICLSSRKLTKDIFLIESRYSCEENRFRTIESLVEQSEPKLCQSELFRQKAYHPKVETKEPKKTEQLGLFKVKSKDQTKGGELDIKKKEEISESIVPYIGKNKKNGDTGVILVSTADPELEKEDHDYILLAKRLRKELIEIYRLKSLRIYIILDATKADLDNALNNPEIQHITVNGHGNWSEWIDSDGERVNNDNICVFDEEGLETKSFIRHTCGKPSEDDQIKELKYYDDLIDEKSYDKRKDPFSRSL